MATANSNEAEYDYPVGYEPEVQTETVELDRRTVERLDASLRRHPPDCRGKRLLDRDDDGAPCRRETFTDDHDRADRPR